MTRLEQLKKLSELHPDDSMTHYGLALEFINLEQWEQAVAACGRALEIDEKFSAAYFHKARAEINAGRHADARATLAAGIETAQAAGDMKTVDEMRDLLDSMP